MADIPSRTEDSPPAGGEPLHSWKEIAVYLHRDVRTVQRWEKTEGLPVHRHLHRVLGSVYAHRTELDAWWNNHRATLETQEPAEGPGAEPGVPEGAPAPRRLSAGFRTVSVALLVFVLGSGLLVAGLTVWRRAPQLAPVHKTAGLLLATIHGSTPDSKTGANVFAADVNGDGVPDAIVSAEAAGETGMFFGGTLRNTQDFAEGASVLVREEHGHWLRLIGTADINGDGIADLISVEMLPDPEDLSATGPVLVLFGRRHWKSRLSLPRDADIRLSLNVSYEATIATTPFGARKDLNGDGMDDLILAAGDFSPPDRASAGAVFVLWGRRQWPKEMEIAASADITVWGAEKGSGLAEVEVGDVDGDGKNDLVVAAGDGSLWGLRKLRGSVYIFLGRNRFPRRLDAATDYDVHISGAQENAQFGRVAVGDVNGDGVQDILVGAPHGPARRSGNLLAFYGRRTWPRNLNLSQANWEVADSDPTGQFGAHVVSYDLNRDAYDDLVVCAPASRRSQLFAFFGNSHRAGFTPVSAADFMLQSDDPNGATCEAKPAFGDFDGNGAPKVLTGAVNALGTGNAKTGKAYVFAPFLPIQIDIRPLAYPNVVWPGSGHVVSIAVPAREGFDPQSLEIASLRFAGVPAASSSTCAFQLAGASALCVFFDSKELRLKPSDRVGVLTGKTKDGSLVFGADSVLVLQESSSRPK